jgi:DNA repair ATPase RecN
LLFNEDFSLEFGDNASLDSQMAAQAKIREQITEIKKIHIEPIQAEAIANSRETLAEAQRVESDINSLSRKLGERQAASRSALAALRKAEEKKGNCGGELRSCSVVLLFPSFYNELFS